MTDHPATQTDSHQVSAVKDLPTNGLGHSSTQRKLVSRIQDSIDDQGRYSGKLKDFSLGYAAAKGISEHHAKMEISGIFEKEIGVSPMGYLEQHRIENGLSIEPSQSREGR